MEDSGSSTALLRRQEDELTAIRAIFAGAVKDLSLRRSGQPGDQDRTPAIVQLP